MTTLRQRIARLAPVLKKFPALGCSSARDLERWVKLELGAVDALESWQKRGPHRTRAVAPAVIYHVLAGNLAVSGQQSLLCGLLLGAHNVVKVPSGEGSRMSILQKTAPFSRPVSLVEVEMRKFVAALPREMQKQVALSHEFDAAAVAHADAVIAYGADDTITKIASQIRDDQIFLGYGLQVSALWLGKVKRLNARQLQAIAHDICIYDQMGCLSPQAIYVEPGSATESFCAALAKAMKEEIARLPLVIRSPGELGTIFETIDMAQAHGHRIWRVAAKESKMAGAVIFDPRPEFQFSCLHRTIFVHEARPETLPKAFDLVRGKISTMGILGRLSPRLEKIFIGLGVKRFCPVGEMQHPPLWWHHDGRPAISDLVRWVDNEIT